MNNINTLKVFALCVFMFSCIEEIPLETQTTFNEVLVIEGTITNELKHQTIKLSKSYRLEAEESNLVSNATISVNDDLGNSYTFEETEPGIYISSIAFAAQTTIKYRLEVIESGITYTSSQESFIQPTQINQLYLERDFNENNEEGISIYVDTFDPTGNSKYYRYDYEETYKIIAPRYTPLELIDLEADLPVSLFLFSSNLEIQDYLVELVSRQENVSICYNTVKSNTIIIENTNNFPEDRLDKYRVRFISRDNYIMSHRYSILVKQYVQSSEANNYYNTLKNFSVSENVFSENQVGFLEGNITSDSNSKKVIGFFEVSPVDSKRIYFNYTDEFPDEDLPPYYTRCDDEIYPLLYKVDPLTSEITESFLVNALNTGFVYAIDNVGDNLEFTPIDLYPFVLVSAACGDCTVLGSTNIPEFWEE